MSRPRSGRGTGQRVLSRHFCGPESIARKERDAMKVVTTKGFATTRSTRHATERAEIEVPISTDPYASVRNSSGARNDRRETIASRPETNSWRLSATLDVRGVKAMQPELYFYEQWLRERHADIQAAGWAARLRPNMTEMPIDAPPSTNTRAQARKERVMRRLPTGDRTAHAADSILTEILRRGTVRIALVVVVPPLRFEDENGNLQGYEIDIANRLAKDLGVTIDWIKTNAAGRVAVLQTRQADITIASFTPTLELLKTIGFTDPYSTAVISLLSRTDRKDLGSVADFNRPEVKFAVPRGTTMATAIATYTPKATVVEVSTFADMIGAFYAGQTDAVALPEAMVNWIAKNSGGKYRDAGALEPPRPPAPGDEAAIGFPQGDFVWWLWLNRFVREINEDGTNYTLWIRWCGDAPMPPFIKPPPKSR